MILGKTLRKKLKITAEHPSARTVGKALGKYDLQRNVLPEERGELVYIKIRLARCGLTKEEMIEAFWAYKESIGRNVFGRTS